MRKKIILFFLTVFILSTSSVDDLGLSTKITAGAGYLRQDNNKITEGNDYSGIRIFSRLHLSEKARLFAIYDRIVSMMPEGDSDPWNNAKDGSSILADIDFSPLKNLRISPNFIGYVTFR